MTAVSYQIRYILNLAQMRKAALVTPGGNPPCGLRICFPHVRILDLCREEFHDAHGSRRVRLEQGGEGDARSVM